MDLKTARLIRSLQRHMPAFVAAARHGSFTLAGEKLGLTQSAISRQIKDMENKLGREVFRRQHKQVILNEAGEKIFCAYSFATQHLGDAIEDVLQKMTK